MSFNEGFIDHIITNYPDCHDMVAFDIGANQGKYTVPMAKKFRKVYAFEMVDETCETLQQVLKTNGISNVEIVKMAVMDKDGDFPMYYQGANPKNRGGNTMAPKVAEAKRWGHDPNRFRTVKGITLDTFCKEREINNLRFIKMDIEGGEDFAWEGAIHTLENNYLDILLEVHNAVDYDKLQRFFMERKYNIYGTDAQAAHFKVDSHYLVTNRS